MTTNRTFTMIKPDAVEKGHIGGILNMITEAGFRIVAMKLTQLTVLMPKLFMPCIVPDHFMVSW